MQRYLNIFLVNCHTHVAHALNIMKYQGRSDHTMVSVWWLLIREGKFVSWVSVLYTYSLYLVFGTLVAGILIINFSL